MTQPDIVGALMNFDFRNVKEFLTFSLSISDLEYPPAIFTRLVCSSEATFTTNSFFSRIFFRVTEPSCKKTEISIGSYEICIIHSAAMTLFPKDPKEVIILTPVTKHR